MKYFVFGALIALFFVCLLYIVKSIFCQFMPWEFWLSFLYVSFFIGVASLMKTD